MKFYTRISDSFRSKLRRMGKCYEIEGWWSGYSSSNPGAQRPQSRFYSFEKPGLIYDHQFSDNTILYWRVKEIKYVPRMKLEIIHQYSSILEECLV